MQQCIAYIDDNGEVERYEPMDSRSTLGNKWVATFQQGMAYLARLKLKGEVWSVYAYIVEHLDYDNWVRLKQVDIAKDLGIDQSNVSKALKKLVEVDVIVRGPDAGKCHTYRMNPLIAHRGARHYKHNIIQYEELKSRRRGVEHG